MQNNISEVKREDFLNFVYAMLKHHLLFKEYIKQILHQADVVDGDDFENNWELFVYNNWESSSSKLKEILNQVSKFQSKDLMARI